jgi:uncharacterized protein (TIGR02300 family)
VRLTVLVRQKSAFASGLLTAVRPHGNTDVIAGFKTDGTKSMTKPELGDKRDCPECGARFYDLNKEPAHCPKCGHEFVPEALLKPRKTRAEEEGAERPAQDTAKPEQETSLQSADEEKKAPASKRRAALDEEENEEVDEDDELADIEDIEVDIDDEDDDNLLDDDDDNDDVSSIVKGGGDESG